MSKSKLDVNFFRTQSQRLVNHFGPDVYTKERLGLVWREVSDLQDKQFEKLVNFLIGEYSVRYPPTVSVIRDQVNSLKKQEEQKIENSGANRWKKDFEDRQESPDGLNNALKSAGASSLLEAVLKMKPKQQGS